MRLFKQIIIFSLYFIGFSCIPPEYYHNIEGEKQIELDFNTATLHYKLGKYDSAYYKLLKINENVTFFRVTNTQNVYYQKTLKLGAECEPKFKMLCTENCIKALDNNNIDMALKHLKGIRKEDVFGKNISNLYLIDSLNFLISSKYLYANDYDKAFYYVLNIKDLASNPQLYVPHIILIGEKALDNDDLDVSAKVSDLLNKFDHYFREDINFFRNRMDSLHLIKERELAEEIERIEKEKPQFEVDGLRIIINKAGKWVDNNEFNIPKKGFVFYACNITIINISNKRKSVNPLYFSLIDEDGYNYGFYIFGKEPTLQSGDLEPNERTRGYITFEILNSAINLKVRYKPWW